MSDELHSALQNDAADGSMVVGYVAWATVIGADGEQRWMLRVAENQTATMTLGMLHMALRNIERELDDRMRPDEDDS